jgi:transposase
MPIKASGLKCGSKGDFQRARTVIHFFERWFMSRSYSLDLRRRIALRVQNGHARRSTAEHFGVSPTYAMNLLHNVDQTESPDLTRQGRHPGHGKLAANLKFNIGQVRAKCDITIPELTAILLRETGVPVDPSSLSRQLRKSGISYQKKP